MIEVMKDERNNNLINELLEVWESSVRGTHSFLSNDEILEIKEYVPSALKNVSHLIIYREKDDKLVAFMGIEENKLEMLFVDYKDRGKCFCMG